MNQTLEGALDALNARITSIETKFIERFRIAAAVGFQLEDVSYVLRFAKCKGKWSLAVLYPKADAWCDLVKCNSQVRIAAARLIPALWKACEQAESDTVAGASEAISLLTRLEAVE